MARQDKNPHDGVVVVDKPAGITSHDVVDEVRRIFRQRKVGHAGTLDPAATGVLVVCLGRATRLSEYLVESEKEYRGSIRLGVETDTYDSDGAVTAERDASGVTRDAVAAALERFVGEIDQRPPAYSAIKRGGVPAYKLARRGEVVDIPARRVRIESIELLAWDPPDARVVVRCHAGTYMRSLAHDLGEVLAVGGHLRDLERTASSGWHIDDAVTLERLREVVEAGRIPEVLRSFDSALRHLPRVDLDDRGVKDIECGRPVRVELETRARLAGAHDASGRLIAVLAPISKTRWQPKKVFPRAP